MLYRYSRGFGPPISFSAWKQLSLQLARAWRRGYARAPRFWCIDLKVIPSDILPLFEIPSSFPFNQRLRVPPAFCILDEKSSPTYDCCNQRTNSDALIRVNSAPDFSPQTCPITRPFPRCFHHRFGNFLDGFHIAPPRS